MDLARSLSIVKPRAAANDQPGTILCLGAHADDIEIGCGATLFRLLRETPGGE